MAAAFASGDLLLMAVVLVYHFGVARVRESAVTGCGLLPGLSAPLFLATSWLAARRDSRRGRTDRC